MEIKASFKANWDNWTMAPQPSKFCHPRVTSKYNTPKKKEKYSTPFHPLKYKSPKNMKPHLVRFQYKFKKQTSERKLKHDCHKIVELLSISTDPQNPMVLKILQLFWHNLILKLWGLFFNWTKAPQHNFADDNLHINFAKT